jgi:hypothetical protein
MTNALGGGGLRALDRGRQAKGRTIPVVGAEWERTS